jgi:hypothetical protein
VVEFLDHEVGEVPKTLSTLGPSKFRVTFDDKKLAEKAVGLNERRVEGTNKKIRATLVESRVSLWEAISYITEKLEADDRKSMKMGNPPAKESHEYRRRTWVVEGEVQETQTGVAEVKEQKIAPDKGRQNPPQDHPGWKPGATISSRTLSPTTTRARTHPGGR